MRQQDNSQGDYEQIEAKIKAATQRDYIILEGRKIPHETTARQQGIGMQRSLIPKGLNAARKANAWVHAKTVSSSISRA